MRLRIEQRNSGTPSAYLEGFLTAEGSGCELARIGLPSVMSRPVRAVALMNTPVGALVGSQTVLVDGLSLEGATEEGGECNGGVFDLQADPGHCGECSNACSASMECVAGECACPAPKARCGARCFDVQTSANHCGACNVVCPSGEVCQGGACVNQDTTDTPANP